MKDNEVLDWDGGGVEGPAEGEEVLDLDGGSASGLKPTMTDEDVKAVKDVLADLPTDPDMEKAKAQAAIPREGEFINANVTIDPNTGERKMVTEDDDEESEFITETFEEFIEKHKDDTIDTTIKDEAVIQLLNEQYDDIGLAAEDMLEVVEILKEYQQEKITPNSAFMKFPAPLRTYFNEQAALVGIPHNQIGSVRRQFVKQMLDDMITDSTFNKYIIDMNNELKAIYKEFGEDMSKFYKDSFAEKIYSLKNAKEKLVDSDDEKKEEKMAALDEIIDGMEQSISLSKLIEAAPTLKIKHFDMERPEKLVRDFNCKYTNSKYSIQDLKTIFPILIKNPVNMTHEDAVLFGVCFCKFCKKMKPTNIAEHTFMYYTIANIISLGIYSNGEIEPDEYAKKLAENIKKVVSVRRERDAARESQQ